MRAGVFPRWLGLCLFVGDLTAIIGNILLDKSTPFIGELGVLLFFLNFSAFGVVLLSQRNLLEERPAHLIVARDALPTDR